MLVFLCQTYATIFLCYFGDEIKGDIKREYKR